MSATQPPVSPPPAVQSSPDAVKLAPAALTLENRTPFAGFVKKLDVQSQIDGYVLFWINDEPGRIPTLLRHGYEFVTPKEVPYDAPQLDGLSQNRDIADKVSRPTRTMGVNGQPMLMYLMKLKQEFYEQDEQARQARQGQIDNAIAGGGVESQGEHVYRPDVQGGRVSIGTVGGQPNNRFPSGMKSASVGAQEKVMTGLGKRR